MNVIKNVPSGQRTQMIFFNDNTFQFRKLPVRDAAVAIKNGEDIELAWPALNKLLLPFFGLPGIKKTKVLICCENDIIFDVFNRLSDDEKPETGPQLVKNWIKSKAETVRYRHQSKPKVSSLMNRVTLFLGASLVLMVLILGITALRGLYGD